MEAKDVRTDLLGRLAEASRTDLNQFTEFTFQDIDGEYFKNPWHVKDWIEQSNEFDHLQIEAPREHAKTQTFTIGKPLFELGQNTDLRTLICSSVHDKAKERIRILKEHLKRNRRLALVFPGLKIGDRSTDLEVYLERKAILKEASIRAAYVGSSIAGDRFDLIILDDPSDWLHNSTTTGKRAKVRRWFYDEVMNSLAPGGQIIVIGTRQHHEDLYETIKADPRFKCLTYRAWDDTGALGYLERNIEAEAPAECVLWPARHNLESLMAKREADENSFMRQYQQIAVPDTGLVYPRIAVDRAFGKGKDNVFNKEAKQFLAIDPGFGVRCSMLAVQELAGDRVEVWREYSFTQIIDDDIAKKAVAHAQEFGLDEIYIDAEDPGLAAAIDRELIGAGFKIKIMPVPFAKYKKLAIKAIRWLMDTSRMTFTSSPTIQYTPGREQTVSNMFRAEIKEYALVEGKDEAAKGDDHGPDALAAYGAKWIGAWLKATGQKETTDD